MTIAPAKALLLTTALTLAALGARAAHAADVFTLEVHDLQGRTASSEVRRRHPGARRQLQRRERFAAVVVVERPRGTRSFVFVVSDPDAVLGAGITHWVAYGISPETTSFAEGEASQPSGKYVAGKSTKNIPGFGGPCPPPGSPHHYLFQIVATDLDPQGLAANHLFGAAGEAQRPSQGRIEPRRDLRQPLSAVIEAAAFAGSRIAIFVSP